MDKYEALEYLIHRMFYKGMEHESNPQIIKHIFQTVSDNRDFLSLVTESQDRMVLKI